MVLDQRRIHWLNFVVHVGAWVPMLWGIYQAATGNLSFDPIREATLRTGRTALVLLLLSLACTPLQILTRQTQVGRLRKPLGLYAFAYACLHLAIYLGLDYGLNLRLLANELAQKTFIQVGLLAFLILAALAVTSTRGWIARLKKAWKRLHRAVYLAAALAVLHDLLVAKGDKSVPILYGLVLALLLLVRIPGIRAKLDALAARREKQA